MIKITFFVSFLLFFTACEKASINAAASSSDTIEPVVVEGNVSSSVPSECYNTTLEAATSKKMLTLLVNYKNQSIHSSEYLWSKKLYGKNTHELNSYYLEVSQNRFEFAQASENAGCSNDGIISVKLNKNHPNSSYFTAIYPDLTAALKSADIAIDFSNYDTDANGKITPDELVLTFIIAGYEDAYEGTHVYNGVWAHMSCMDSSETALLDGVSLMGCANDGNFALFGELHDRYYTTHDATIGIIAHELGHSAFNLPDLYNTQGSTGGIGVFGLMGSGSWAQSSTSEFAGETPTHFTPWSKIENGWVTPITVQSNNTYTLNETASDSYNVLKIPINASEYYLLENRNNSGYDKGLFTLEGNFNGGLALWHVNTTKLTSYYLSTNTVNADTSNKAVDLVEATNNIIDYSADTHGDEKNLFYNPNRTSYTSQISDISTRASVMTLNIN